MAAAPVALLFSRGRDSGGRIERLVSAGRALRPVLGTLATPLVRRGLHEKLGFRCLDDYARRGRRVAPVWECAEAIVAEALGSIPPVLVTHAAAANEIPHGTAS